MCSTHMILSYNRLGALLVDDMGLGKTLQAITLSTYLHEEASLLTKATSPGRKGSCCSTDISVQQDTIMGRSVLVQWEGVLWQH